MISYIRQVITVYRRGVLREPPAFCMVSYVTVCGVPSTNSWAVVRKWRQSYLSRYLGSEDSDGNDCKIQPAERTWLFQELSTAVSGAGGSVVS